MRPSSIFTFFIVISLFVLTFTSCKKDSTPSTPNVVSISDLLPRDKDISNWSREAASDGSWIATNSTQLQEKIDGGFELYANHGFIEAAMQKYSGIVNGQAAQLEAQVYNQGSAANADAVFDDPNNVFANPITPNNPPSAKAQISKDLFGYTMKYTKLKYYVRLTIISSDDKAQEIIEIFANNIASRIK